VTIKNRKMRRSQIIASTGTGKLLSEADYGATLQTHKGRITPRLIKTWRW